MRTALYAAIAVVGIGSPSFAQSNTRHDVEQLMEAYGGLFDKKDAAAVAALYTDDAVVVSPTSPTMVVKTGRQEIQTYLQYMLDHDYHIEGKVNSVAVLGDNAAIVLGEYHTIGITGQGSPFDASGHWTALDVRDGNTWKIRLLTAVPTPRQ